MPRISLLPIVITSIAAFVAARATAQDLSEAKAASTTGGIVWKKPDDRGVEGRGWTTGLARFYDRLPAKAEGRVPPHVWAFSRESAGMSVDFITDSPEIRVRYRVTSAQLDHGWGDFSNRTGSGVDLYARTEGDSTGWHWIAANKPLKPAVDETLVRGLAPGKKHFRLYLPSYNGVESLEIGVRSGAFFQEPEARKTLPVVFYGTSIMQGGAASRPGLAMTSIIGRRLDTPVVNLGFCGAGRMEPEVGALIAEISAAAYVIDCVPNMNAGEVRSRTAPLVRQLRTAHPATPILLTNHHDLPTPAAFTPASVAEHRGKQAALREVYDELVREGVPGVHYLPGDTLIGDDGEGTGDGVHPNDLGHMRYAEAYVKALRPLIAAPK